MGSLGHTLSLRSLMLHSLSLETGQEKLGPVLLSDKKSPRGIARSTIFAQLLFFPKKIHFWECTKIHFTFITLVAQLLFLCFSFEG